MFNKKDPNRKQKIAALFILFLFLGSSLALAIIQAFDFGFKSSSKQQSLPGKVSYVDINADLRNVMISNYYMIITYQYPENCTECNQSVTYLSNFVQDKVDAYLVILKANNQTLEFENQKDLRNLDPKNETGLLDAYCDMTYSRYDQCITRKI